MELLRQSDLGLSLAGLMDAKQAHLVRKVFHLIKHHSGETSWSKDSFGGTQSIGPSEIVVYRANTVVVFLCS